MTQSEQLQKLSNLYDLQSLIDNLGKNLSLIQNGNQGKIITVNGGSLYQLAAKYYGNATLWNNIASANNLVDPQLPKGVTMALVIPTQTTNTDGVYTP